MLSGHCSMLSRHCRQTSMQDRVTQRRPSGLDCIQAPALKRIRAKTGASS